jgi:predicted transcriptional regulator
MAKKTNQEKVGISKIQPSPEQRRCRGPQDLSRLELECMKAIWLEGAVTVLQVQNSLKAKRPLAYTTILTVLDRLAKKGALQRIRRGKAYHYEPTLSFVDSRETALAQLIDFYFQGSVDELLHHVAGSGHPQPVSCPSKARSANSPEMTECLL